ncbi:hypothetical protein AMAG_08813 [Allomyces macrogynus ATCC 38327]|uniref:Uncharacterized protein n=1 Tax=Allomyces macrogynus (strain ATCC 38327) TaxID=578462 RepID=A0A0L0SMD1_ALLM3|nr:hypothetical protein AMAG_08813 [Allomyces macrogynus ATCC 38327]|eukprot:KNE63726.1 hypothetical protein AMAG_08813 [Allomyces macrogynus ATCC 38327]
MAVLGPVMKLEHLPDHLLTMTMDVHVWINSLDSTFVRDPPAAVVQAILARPFVKPDWPEERALLDALLVARTRIDTFHALLSFGQLLLEQLRATEASASGRDGAPVDMWSRRSSKNPSRMASAGTSRGDDPDWVAPSVHEEDVARAAFEEKMAWLMGLFAEALSGSYTLPSSTIAALTEFATDVEKLDVAQLQLVCAQITPFIANKAGKTGPPMAIFPDVVSPAISNILNADKPHTKMSNAQELKFINNMVEQDHILASLEGIWLQVDSDPDRLVMPSQVGIQEQALEETLVSCSPGILEFSYNSLTWYGLERDANAATATFTPGLTLLFPMITRFSLGRIMDATLLPYGKNTLHTILGGGPSTTGPGGAGGGGSGGSVGGALGAGGLGGLGGGLGGGGGLGQLRRDETATIKAFYLNIFTATDNFRLYPFYEDEIYKAVDMIAMATGLVPFKESQFVKYTVAKRLQMTRHHILDAILARHRHRAARLAASATVVGTAGRGMPVASNSSSTGLRGVTSNTSDGASDMSDRRMPASAASSGDLDPGMSVTSSDSDGRTSPTGRARTGTAAAAAAAAGALGRTASGTGPWIDHSADLIKVLRKLTQEREPQALYDLELLYHSCRIEAEVTKETLHHLRVLWHQSQSETVRLKVLAILDRLLDRSVMREGDPNFTVLYKWLRHLEETVSPYKSAESLKIILVLLRRAKAIQTDPLTPIAQIQASFDCLPEYDRFARFFG